MSGIYGNYFLKDKKDVNEAFDIKESEVSFEPDNDQELIEEHGGIKFTPVSTNLNMSIHVDISDSRNFGNDIYFKVYDNTSYKKATKVARVNLFYVGTESHKGKDQWILTNKDGKNINEFLDLKYKNDPSKTIYQSMIDELKKYNKIPKDYDEPRQDYSKIGEVKQTK